MCGIVGILNPRTRLSADALRAAARRMTDALAHRGPDDADVWVSGDAQCALGHRRLSVIDLSAAARQPMLDSAGQHALVFNGEIYNYRDLRRGLEGGGYPFATHSDTEVLLAALRQGGEAILGMLDGMFALGRYNTVTRELLLARDPFGEKPLYYWASDDYFVFASELSAILASGLFHGGIEADELAMYLHFRYLPHPRTLYRDIAKLEPGHSLRVHDGQLHKKRYFQFQLSENLPVADPRQIAEALEHELTQAVKSRLVSDVPLGAFLSSGVDSSLVCALAVKKLGVNLNTYTIAFDGGESEHEDAARIAQTLGTTHHCHAVSHADLLDVAARMGHILDEPNGDRSCVPTWLLARFARQDITVALSGDGGDELFAGYGRYFAAQAALGDDADPAKLATLYFERYLPVMPLEHLAHLFGGLPARLTQAYAERIAPLPATRGVINRLRLLDAESYLPGAVLAKVDRMSMAHGLEVRAPLLAGAIARLAGRIPLAQHLADGKGKFLLRHILKKYLPAAWVDRRKTGFGMPPAFLKAHAGFFGAELARAAASDSALASVLDIQRLRALLPNSNNNVIWAVIVLNQWLEKAPGLQDRRAAPDALRALTPASQSPDSPKIDLPTPEGDSGFARQGLSFTPDFTREDNDPRQGEDILPILGKPLPRRQDAPPPGIETLIADFNAAGLGAAPLNVFTYHTRVAANYQPITTFDIRGLDHRAFDYDYILAYFSHAAAGVFPGCNVILVTDHETPLPAVHRFTHVVRLDVRKDEPMYQRARAMAAYVNSAAFTATTLFLDSDAFVGQDFSAALADDFDIAVTFRPNTGMVLNEGVQAASHRRPERARAFYNGYLATYEALSADPDIAARYPNGIKHWRGGQLSLNVCAWNGQYPEAGEIRDQDGTRILYLPCEIYNHKPGPSDSILTLLDKAVAHFKGTAKEFSRLRRYTLESNPPGWALADLTLAQAARAPDANAADPRDALMRHYTDLLKQSHYAAARALCEDLLAQDREPALAHGLLALYHFRVNADWNLARVHGEQALAMESFDGPPQERLSPPGGRLGFCEPGAHTTNSPDLPATLRAELLRMRQTLETAP